MEFRKHLRFVQAAATLVIALLCWLMLLPSCSRNLSESDLEAMVVQNCDYNVNHFLLNKLCENRIVMLADQGHGYPMYLQRVISFLNYWVDTLERANLSRDAVPANLIFIVEVDSVNSSRRMRLAEMDCTIDSLKPDELVTQNTIEKLEYYSDLVRLLQRIDRHNADCRGRQPIRFRIASAESVFTGVDNWSYDQRSEYFIHRRDEQTSERIIKMLEDEPDAKALIFYGSAHFARGKVLKKTDKQSAEGYYLNHYLTEEFGRNHGVYAVDQIAAIPGRPIPQFLRANDSTYALDYACLPRRQMSEALGVGSMDGAIVDFDRFVPPTPLSDVNSQRTVDMIVSRLGEMEDTQNDFYRDAWNGVLRYLHSISGVPIVVDSMRDTTVIHRLRAKWTVWHDTVHLHVVEDISGLVYFKRLVDLMSTSEPQLANWYETMIARHAGFRPHTDAFSEPAERAAKDWHYIQERRYDIVVSNLIPLLWVGTSDEKNEALQVLKRETGKDFQTAKEWTVWWRENCPTLPSM